MKPEIEVYRAHDMLTAIVLNEVPAVADRWTVRIALDVLCWVLDHDKTEEQNHAFADNLQKIEAELERRGFKLSRKNN